MMIHIKVIELESHSQLKDFSENVYSCSSSFFFSTFLVYVVTVIDAIEIEVAAIEVIHANVPIHHVAVPFRGKFV